MKKKSSWAGKKIKEFNQWFAVKATGMVGTMECAYLFTLLALVSLPSVLSTGNVVQIVAWITQTFLQLVLLSVLMVGQNIMGQVSEKRTQETHQIVLDSHKEQMKEMADLRELLKAEQEERNELKKMVEEMSRLVSALSLKSNPPIPSK